MCQHDHKDDDYIHPLQLIQKPQLSRRQALRTMGGFGAALLLAACNQQLVNAATSAAGTDGSTGATNGSCAIIPTETEGPYPASSVLTNSTIYRQNITDSKAGVPLTVILNLQNVNADCAAVSNANGQVTFTTIYPGWYAGRITHLHFEVFLNNSLNSSPTKISQVAFPQAVTSAVYSSSLYSSRGQNTSVTSFSQDNVFSDGTTYQMATVSGDVSSGYVATLNVGISG